MKTKTCIYDNPDTMCRELWIDGKMWSSGSIEVIQKTIYVRKWESGRIDGDKEALMKTETPEERKRWN